MKVLQDLNSINLCTYDCSNQHLSHYLIEDEKEIGPLIKKLHAEGKKYHVCSNGKNWGYGSHIGDNNNTVLLDLSQLRGIEINEDAGYVTLQAGCTQRDVYNLLKKSNSNLMLPVTGSCPDSSVLGNAAAYGYGNGRSTIRKMDILQANGYDARHQFIEGINQSSAMFGTHSQLDKLWCRGSVLTSAKLRLPKIPREMMLVAFSIEDELKLQPLLEKLMEYKDQSLIEGNWSVFSGHRLLAERERKRSLGLPMTKQTAYGEVLSILKKYYGYKTWNGAYNGVFAIYSLSKEIIKSTLTFLKNDFSELVDQVQFIEVSQDQILKERRSNNGFSHIKTDMPILGRLRTFCGILGSGSVEMSYWKMDNTPEVFDLDHDGCGFIWSALSAPTNSQKLTDSMRIINSCLKQFQIDPIFVVDGVLPNEVYIMTAIIFNKKKKEEEENARVAYDCLNQELIKIGLIHYREPSGISSQKVI